MKKRILVFAFIIFVVNSGFYSQSSCNVCKISMSLRAAELKEKMHEANTTNQSILDDAISSVDFKSVEAFIEIANKANENKNEDAFSDAIWALSQKAKEFMKPFNEAYKGLTDLRILTGFTWIDNTVFNAYVYTGYILEGKKVYLNLRTNLPMIILVTTDSIGRVSINYQVFSSYKALALHTSSELRSICKGHYHKATMDDLVQKWSRKAKKEDGKTIHYHKITVEESESE